ncbi:MAG TPA: hypothetical protein HPP83_08720 [Candidatus Hydrogenedentes bacterium]|nr:hypothetical protein [Candidatus Hydrogenedentota bacterium]
MEAPQRITRLCESWWEKLANSTKAEQNRYAEEFLSLLGWADPVSLAPKEAWAELAGAAYLLRGGSTSVIAYFVMPGVLDPPASIGERGLDHCQATRTLTNAAGTLHIEYAFITDLQRSYLYDVPADELILHADTPTDLSEQFGDGLSKPGIERGSLMEIRRKPRSYVARELREWRHRWCGTLAIQSQQSEAAAALVVDRLIVLRYLFIHNVLKRSGRRAERRFNELIDHAFSPSPRGCGKALASLFHDTWLDWRPALFAPAPEVNQIIELDVLAAPMLREFALLSDGKFNIATVLESFNYGEPAEKARVRIIPDANEERETYLAKQTVETVDAVRLEVDIMDEGYRAVLHWLDKLSALYDRLEIEYESASYRARAIPDDIDLFAWSELDASRPRAFADKLQHLFERSFVVYYASPRQYRTARLLLYLHLITRFSRTKQRLAEFPPIEKALRPRPKVLDADRKEIFRGRPEDENWEVT